MAENVTPIRPGVLGLIDRFRLEEALELAKMKVIANQERRGTWDLDDTTSPVGNISPQQAYARTAGMWYAFNARMHADGKSSWDGVVLEHAYNVLASVTEPEELKDRLLELIGIAAEYYVAVTKREYPDEPASSALHAPLTLLDRLARGDLSDIGAVSAA